MKKLLLLFIAISILGSCDKERDEKIKETFDPYTQLVLNSGVDARANVQEPPYPIDTIIRYAFNMGMKYPGEHGIQAGKRAISVHDLENRKLRVGEMSDVVEIDVETKEPKLGYFVVGGVRDVVLLTRYHSLGDPDFTRPDLERGWIDAYLSFDMGHGYSFSGKHDTIGYVPNTVLFAAKKAVRDAFAKEDWEECMRLFEEAYTFIPITGAEWLELNEEDVVDDSEVVE